MGWLQEKYNSGNVLGLLLMIDNNMQSKGWIVNLFIGVAVEDIEAVWLTSALKEENS